MKQLQVRRPNLTVWSVQHLLHVALLLRVTGIPSQTEIIAMSRIPEQNDGAMRDEKFNVSVSDLFICYSNGSWSETPGVEFTVREGP